MTGDAAAAGKAGKAGEAGAGAGEVSLPITGGCNCGAVRFEVTAPFEASMYCHCTRCQRRTGTAASANARTAPETFRVIQGEDRIRSWDPPDGAPKFFCGDCGSALFSRSSGSVGIRLGAVDGDPGIRPAYRQYVAYAAPWEPIPDDGLPRHPEARGA
ncbi:MAG TPA: GFA family protein [Solirubrobacteraceae bacterium]|jgi:hypothetical protein